MKNRLGITLMEMLVAMIICGIVAWIAMEMFSGQKGNYTRTREKIRMQNDAREAMRVIEADLRNTGFRTLVASDPTRLAGTPSSCDAPVLDGDRSALTAGNNDALIGDTLRIRYIEPASDGSVVCYGLHSGFREIGYRQSGSILQRMTRKDTTQAPTWVDLLDNVVTFQVEYGLLTDPTDSVATSADLTSAGNWAGSSGLLFNTTSGVLTLSGWASSSMMYAQFTPQISLNPLYTYHIAFDMNMNDNMRLGAKGIDSSATTPYPAFWIGFFSSSNLPMDTLYQYPRSPDPGATFRHIDAYINPTHTGSSYFGICTRLKSGGSLSQSLTISNASITVVSRGQYWSWVNAPTPAQKPLVKALKVNLLVRTENNDKEGAAAQFTGLDANSSTTPLNYRASGPDSLKSHILYQRIIPVVNNGI